MFSNSDFKLSTDDVIRIQLPIEYQKIDKMLHFPIQLDIIITRLYLEYFVRADEKIGQKLGMSK